MQIHTDYNLTKLNTFGVSVNAKYFVKVESENDILELLKMEVFSARGGSDCGGKDNKRIVLGGGSNVLFTKDFDGLVILNKLKGIEVVDENNEYVLIRSMSGELWHNLVSFTLERGLWGIENLAFVPGTVGAAPMQNIGAYGAELKNTLESVEAFSFETGEKRIFMTEECELGYRDSVFKNALKNKYFITAITIKLSKKENKNISYKILKDYLEQNNIEVKSSRDVGEAVTAIRKSKLPDPKVIGNAGSFFKNIFVSKEKLAELKINYPGIPSFEEDEKIKVPAGWLIEQCGPESGTSWKGLRIGSVGVHDKQALVLVNHNGATGAEILDLAENIIASVKEKFGLELVPEVNLIP